MMNEKDAYREIWFSALAARRRFYNTDEAFKRFLQRKNAGRTRRLYLNLAKIAAVVALLAVVGYGSYRRGGQVISDKFSDITLEAPVGSKIKTALPDGTLVWLNSGTKLVYSQGFGVSDRNMALEGEGYFEVAANQKLPFSINTKEMSVTVTGTKFNFRNYNDDVEAVINLMEGRVLVNNNMKFNEKVNIARNDKVHINKTSGEMRVIHANNVNVSDWTLGYLSFDEELLPDIVRKLERSYEVTIKLADDPQLLQMRFYGSFNPKKQSVTAVLDYLQSTGRIRYRMRDKEIVITL
ncbi:MAG: FecR family protein [Tannerella sp.]|jgi:ferric-dicitrate binding protein FerR (iron transport regulator)|nr:FecR family protein [Tannerella sp.]